MEHKTLANAIADKLRQEILSDHYSAGTQLRQDALAKAFGASRIPVREALIQLESEGLIKMIPHKGAVVTSLSKAEINDVFDLRLILETRLFKESIPKLTEIDFINLDEIQQKFGAAIRSGDLTQWGKLNTSLHTTLYSRAELPQTVSVVSGLLQKSDRYTRVQLSSKEARKRAEKEHANLIDAAKKKNIQAACAMLAEHIESVRLDLLNILKKNSHPSGPKKALSTSSTKTRSVN